MGVNENHIPLPIFPLGEGNQKYPAAIDKFL